MHVFNCPCAKGKIVLKRESKDAKIARVSDKKS